MTLKRSIKFFILKSKRNKKIRRCLEFSGDIFTPQLFFFLGLLSVFYFFRYTADCWEFDNCRFRDQQVISDILFSGETVRDLLKILPVWIGFYSLLQILFPRKIRDCILALFVTFEILLGLTNFYMIVWYSCSMEDMFAIIRAADQQEVTEYFLSMFYQGNVLFPGLLLLFLLATGIGLFFGMYRFRAGKNKICASAIFLVCAVLTILIHRFDYNNITDPALRFFIGVNTPDPFLLKISRTVNDPRLPEQLKNVLKDQENPVFGMVVIGESDNRRHHSFYGYEKNTDHFLQGAREGMILFTDVISATASTIHSIFFMFTNARIQKKYEYPEYSFCEYFQTAGAEISLHDVQRSHGAWSSALALMFVNADRKVKYSDDGKNHYDEEILPEISLELAEKNNSPKVMVVHLMGSHYDQRYRVPAEWLQKHKTIVSGMDFYDKSITYTGYVLSKLHASVLKKKQPSFLLYIPDHSEKPVSKRSMTNPDKIYYEIPMMLWFNEAYRKCYPETVMLAQKAADKPFQTDLALQLIARLMQIPTHLIKKNDDLLSPDYRPAERLFGWGEIPYDTP